MKTFVLSFLFLPSFLFSQAVDSAAIKQVDSLIQVSRTLSGQRQLEQAFETLDIAEKVALEKFGRESAEYGRCCSYRGRICLNMGNFSEAEKRLLESIGILEKVVGREHPEYAKSLHNLALVYQESGNFENAEQYYLEAKTIREKVLGKEHPDYAWTLNNLANLYGSKGDFEKTELLHLECKAIREKVLGKEHPDYATSLQNLANLYSITGIYEKAEPLLLEAKSIKEKTVGKVQPEYAQCLSVLANLYGFMGNYEKVEPLLLEAMDILEKTFGKEHPQYAFILQTMALLYQETGDYEKAEQLLLEAKSIREKKLGKEHPDYVWTVSALANLSRSKGEFEKAELLHLEVKTIREKAMGKEHPDYGFSLNSLANLYGFMGNYKKAEPFFLELSNANQRLIEKALHHLSERELNSYLNKFSNSQNETLSFTQLSSSKKVVPVCYDNSLFYKGFLLGAASRLNTLAGSTPEAAELHNRLKSYRRRLAAEYAKPIAERKGVEELEEKANTAEKELARTVAGYADASRQVKWQEVQSALKKGEAAIEFVHFEVHFPKKTDSVLYAALLLLPGDEQPIFVPLFEEKQLDSLVQAKTVRRAEYVDNLYAVNERGAVPLGKPQKTLYELIWQPLEKELAGVQTVYFSPSGLLHRLNIGAIPTSGEATLADRYRLVELGSTRQLVIPSEIKIAASDAVLFGGVQYEMDSTAISQANAGIADSDLASRGGLSFAYSDSTLRGGVWSYLKWTEKEVSSLETLLKNSGFKTDLRKGYAATEESFKAAFGGSGKASPRVLHIATHGFFFPDPKTEVRSERVRSEGEPVFKISDHPMIRSGLILAGGNHAWKSGKPLKPDMEDGILTAYEISQMNLSNTELVVLSACETGLGDIEGNEGVYGLQRAFKIAGARYLIMSLWKVPDEQTSTLMTVFYRNWIEGKMDLPEAFRSAQQSLRDAGWEPYYWAGFVLLE